MNNGNIESVMAWRNISKWRGMKAYVAKIINMAIIENRKHRRNIGE
jgi:hypothetical protein